MPFTDKANAQIFVPFTDYLIEQSIYRSSILRSGLMQTSPAITDAVRLGEKFEIPSWNPDLTGDAEKPVENVQLQVNDFGSKRQTGVLHRCGKAWGVGGKVKLIVGANNDPEAALASKIVPWVENEQQKFLLATMQGAFGPPGTDNSTAALAALSVDNTGGTVKDFSVDSVIRCDAKLNEDAESYGILIIHSDTYHYLRLREALNYVNAKELPGIDASTIAANLITASNAVSGDFSGAFNDGEITVPTFAGKRVIASKNAPRTGSPGSYKYMAYLAKPGAVGFGYQEALRAEGDRDILADQNVRTVRWDACMHIGGTTWNGAVDPGRTDLANTANWSKVFENENIGVSAVVHSIPMVF